LIAKATEAVPLEAAFAGKRLKRLICATSWPFQLASADVTLAPLLELGDAAVLATGAADPAGARV
jgi:hypothetical protein